MRERILWGIGGAALAVAAVYCVLFLRNVQEAIGEQALALETQREVSEAMLAELKALREDNKNHPADGWHALRVKLVDEKGRPLQGEV